MNSRDFPFPTIFLFFFIFVIFINIPQGFANPDLYNRCNNTFSCGNIRNVGYPFWKDGGEDCGHPKLKLECENALAVIRIAEVKYRVLNINVATQTLKIARADYMNGICNPEFPNTSFDDFEPSLFDIVFDYQYFTFYYECESAPAVSGVPGHFTCKSGKLGTGYVAVALGKTIQGSCKDSVSIPLPGALVREIGNITRVGEALEEGFEVKWKVDNPKCQKCRESKGVCGFIMYDFACYCETFTGEPNPKTCPTPPPKTSSPSSSQQPPARTKKNSVSLGVGLGIAGAAITGIFLGIWGYSIAQRRKRNAEQSKSKDLPTDMPPTPLSKGLTTPSTNLSQSTPSFLSSKSDLEKGSTYFGIQVFSYTELEEATDNFNPSKELGEGGFGVVYYGLLKDGREVAVKRLYENNFKRVEQFKNEIKILADIRHVNLVTLYGCTSRHSRELLLVYEYIPNGTVADHLHGKLSNSGLLTWPVRLSIAMETANALAYLHAKDIIHRDVKTNNILLDNNFRVKVADFGLSRLFPNDVTHVSTAPQGTPGYVDPEYYQCYQLTDKSDVYSFGVVLMELVSSKQAVDTNRHRHDINLANMAINRIQNHALHELVDPSLGFENDYATRRMTTTMAELAFRCLQQERDMRPSMEEVLGILRGIQNEGLGAEKAEVVDIRSEDMGLLKHIPPPLSPDSSATEKWMQIRSM